MEDVLEVYTRPSDERFPQVCMDESGKQLVAEKLEGLPLQPGQPERYDYSYEQGQMYNLFLACEPLAGKRVVKVTAQKTSQDSCSLYPGTGRCPLPQGGENRAGDG